MEKYINGDDFLTSELILTPEAYNRDFKITIFSHINPKVKGCVVVADGVKDGLGMLFRAYAEEPQIVAKYFKGLNNHKVSFKKLIDERGFDVQFTSIWVGDEVKDFGFLGRRPETIKGLKQVTCDIVPVRMDNGEFQMGVRKLHEERLTFEQMAKNRQDLKNLKNNGIFGEML